MLPMKFNIFFDHVFCNFVTDGPSKISVFPKLASPQLSFNFRVHLKYFSCRSAFKPFDYIRYRISWRKSQKYMYVILGYFHRLYFKLVNDSNFSKTSLHIFPDVTSQNPLAIFWSPNQMISGIIYRMTGSPYCHADTLNCFDIFLKDNVSSPL